MTTRNVSDDHQLPVMGSRIEGEKTMSESMGGEVADRLRAIDGKKYECRCKHQIPLTKGRGGFVMGYPHHGGTGAHR